MAPIMSMFTTPRTLMPRAIATAMTVCAAILILAGGCHVTGHKAPTGFLGLTWGEDASSAARRLGLSCAQWSPWVDPAFETCIDLDHPRPVLGAEGLVRLVRTDGKLLEGVQVVYRACPNGDQRPLRAGLRTELHVKSPEAPVPYEIWSNHALVHFVADPADDTCTLTVAGPRFGKAFEAALLRGGLGDLGTALRPH